MSVTVTGYRTVFISREIRIQFNRTVTASYEKMVEICGALIEHTGLDEDSKNRALLILEILKYNI